MSASSLYCCDNNPFWKTQIKCQDLRSFFCHLLSEKKWHPELNISMIFWHRPNDSRMVVALGETYEKLERLQEAKKCFWKAHSIGDVEGMALIKLAK